MNIWIYLIDHWLIIVFLTAALHAHLRGRIRFPLLRALTDYTVLLAPFNSLLVLFSKVSTRPYLDSNHFPELKLLELNWQVIRAEAKKLNEEGFIKAASAYNDLGFNSFFRTGWKRFYLKWYGQELASAKAFCPNTLALLNSIPSIKAAMFASLPPGSRLVKHRDPYAGSLRYHLGLITPNSPLCFIDVDGERYYWRDGEAVMFDETYIHYAENQSSSPRIILFCDIERPLHSRLLVSLNRLFATWAMQAAATQNIAGEPIGGINRFFSYAYHVRIQAKRLKSYNKILYYTLKWLIIGGALIWILW